MRNSHWIYSCEICMSSDKRKRDQDRGIAIGRVAHVMGHSDLDADQLGLIATEFELLGLRALRADLLHRVRHYRRGRTPGPIRSPNEGTDESQELITLGLVQSAQERGDF